MHLKIAVKTATANTAHANTAHCQNDLLNPQNLPFIIFVENTLIFLGGRK